MSIGVSEASLSDIAAVTNGRNNDGMFGNDWAWIVILLLFGWGGRGFGGYGFGGNGGGQGLDLRHGNKGNVCFADGHAEAINENQAYESCFASYRKGGGTTLTASKKQ